MKPAQEEALISLLGDDDQRVQELIEQKLMALGKECVPLLRRAMGTPAAQNNARRILRRLCQSEVHERFLAFCNGKTHDLERGAFLLAATAYPEVDMEPYHATLDAMAEVLRGRLAGIKSPRAIINRINKFLFREQGFRGNSRDYYDADNSYLNRVMDRRLGIPISLAAIYLCLAQRLQLPIGGVGLPGHFVVKYQDDEQEFFIDAYNEGMILDADDCRMFVEQMGQPFREGMLERISSRETLTRMCANLVNIYQNADDTEATKRMMQYFELLAG